MTEKLEELLRQIKGASARAINRLSGGKRGGRLWQLGSFDHIVRSGASLEKFQRYIAKNPAKAGIELEEGCLHTREYG